MVSLPQIFNVQANFEKNSLPSDSTTFQVPHIPNVGARAVWRGAVGLYGRPLGGAGYPCW